MLIIYYIRTQQFNSIVKLLL